MNKCTENIQSFFFRESFMIYERHTNSINVNFSKQTAKVNRIKRSSVSISFRWIFHLTKHIFATRNYSFIFVGWYYLNFCWMSNSNNWNKTYTKHFNYFLFLAMSYLTKLITWKMINAEILIYLLSVFDKSFLNDCCAPLSYIIKKD